MAIDATTITNASGQQVVGTTEAYKIWCVAAGDRLRAVAPEDVCAKPQHQDDQS